MLSKTILIKLGGKCNLSCGHCHCSKSDYEYNPDIINYIQKNKFTEVIFSGGEPLLYMEIIREIVKQLGKCYQFLFVSNCTLLDDDTVNFLNEYNIQVFLSYDGTLGNRVTDGVDFDKFALLSNKGLAVCVYNKNIKLDILDKDINALCTRYNIPKYYFPNFIHQTALAPNEDMVDTDTVKKYVQQIGERLELDFIKFKFGNSLASLPILNWCIYTMFKDKSHVQGVKCFRNDKINMSLDGQFLLCHYSAIKVGDIYRDINWEYVESFVPKRCKQCEFWNICKNTCVENITENECVIFKSLYRHFLKLLTKYSLTTNCFTALKQNKLPKNEVAHFANIYNA